jgi:hypothetical protein
MTDEKTTPEAKQEQVRKSNLQLYIEFQSWFSSKKPSKSTFLRHINNVDWYLNQYLVYGKPIEASLAATLVPEYLGSWSIQKFVNNSNSALKSSAVSLKKFYEFLLEKGQLDRERYQALCKRIKDGMPAWLESLHCFDDDDVDYPDNLDSENEIEAW